MALHRPEDEAGPDPPGRRAQPDPPGGADGPADADGQAGSHPAGRTVEARSRTEYYEALRVADGKPADGKPADGSSAASDRSGWDSVDAGERPPPEAIRVSPERAAHILDGDRTGGGHRHGAGKPGVSIRSSRGALGRLRSSATGCKSRSHGFTEHLQPGKPSFRLTGMTRRLSMRYRMPRGGPICRPGPGVE